MRVYAWRGIRVGLRCSRVTKGGEMRRFWLSLAVTLVAGCAGSGSADCGPDWRAVGMRDGRINAGSNAQRYAARCGTSVDTAAYEAGYAEGFLQRPIPGW